MEFEIASFNGLLDMSDLADYKTGKAGLDKFIHEEAKNFELANRTALSIAYYKTTVVGVYALSLTHAFVDNRNEHKKKAFGIDQYDRIPLISLDHFSVKKELQYDPSKKKSEQLDIGKNLLLSVYKSIVDIRNKYNVAIAGVVVEALDDAVDWYYKRGFDYADDNEENQVNKESYSMIIGYAMIEEAYLKSL
ncbi:hypothetical protein EFE27_01210 [Leuconostoc citreum]|uniref:hypothetical protein n=1 Tax=Leuconostoc citreum TaxID=33964 RepID=UPI0021821D61|nr:hypothetical protein [Leuconostoc citreum]MCS8594611.1 hypothetical protein [Leuconostoc citreum]